jgi:hypothetical protein
VGESPHSFSLFRPLGKIRCQWHFARSHEEVPALLRHTALDIVISTYTHRIHAEMMALLTGLHVSLLYVLPVEEGCWCLPALRNGENCFGTPAFRPREFTYVLADIVRSTQTCSRMSTWQFEPLPFRTSKCDSPLPGPIQPGRLDVTWNSPLTVPKPLRALGLSLNAEISFPSAFEALEFA